MGCVKIASTFAETTKDEVFKVHMRLVTHEYLRLCLLRAMTSGLIVAQMRYRPRRSAVGEPEHSWILLHGSAKLELRVWRPRACQLMSTPHQLILPCSLLEGKLSCQFES